MAAAPAGPPSPSPTRSRDPVHLLPTSPFDARAACRGHDPELWFTPTLPGNAGYRLARAICGPCPLREVCLDWGLHHEGDGMWGSADPAELDGLRSLLGIAVEVPERHIEPRRPSKQSVSTVLRPVAAEVEPCGKSVGGPPQDPTTSAHSAGRASGAPRPTRSTRKGHLMFDPKPQIPAGAISHGKCGSYWFGTRTAHCGVCCLTFSSTSAFDEHQRGTDGCRPPGECGLVPVPKKWGTCWSWPSSLRNPFADAGAGAAP